MQKAPKISLSIPLAVLCMALSFGAGLGLAPRLGHEAGSASAAQGLPKQFGLLEEIWNILEADYVDPTALDPEKLTVGAINGVMEVLADPHSEYLDAYQNQLRKAAFRGSVGGIGARVTTENRDIVILEVTSGLPADQAGIRPGDRVLVVNGESTRGMSLSEVVNRIGGPPGTVVRITLIHKGETSPFEVEVTCAEVTTRTVMAYILRNGIALVRISYFSARTPSELEIALREMKEAGAQAILLDLRDNPGGLLDSAVDVSSQFLKSGMVVYQVDGRGKSTPYAVRPGGIATDLPMAMLLNSGSSSSSEVVAGALQDSGQAVLVGTVTAGKGSVNWLRDLSDGSGLYVTFARWLTPNGRLIEGKGLSPDIPVERTEADIANQRDPQLEKALGYLEGKFGLAASAGMRAMANRLP